MKRSILIGGAAALLLGGVTVAQSAQPEGRRGDTDGDGRVSQAEFVAARAAAFARRDADGDGRVTREEAEAARAARRAGALDRRFDRLDANDDGAISRDEFAAAAEHRREGRFARHGARMEGRWGRIDADGDGLDLAEVEARAAERFARMDADGDGYVTREDRRARMEARRVHRHGPATPTE